MHPVQTRPRGRFLGTSWITSGPNPAPVGAERLLTDILGGLVDIVVVDRALAEDSRSHERVAPAGRYLGDVFSSIERFVAEAEACLIHLRGRVPARILPLECDETEAEMVK